MRLQLLSDTHFEYHADAGRSFVTSLDPSGVDVLVLAGDIARGSDITPAVGRFCEHYSESTVIYVHGNHEFYGTTREDVVRATRAVGRNHENFVWLDGSSVDVGGRRILGGPLWFRRTDASEAHRALAWDFSEIPEYETWVYDENQRMVDFLSQQLEEGDIVVTHYLPSPHCVAEAFSHSPLNAYFVCDVDDLLRARRPRIWMHGHTHASIDVVLDETRVVCNPLGHPRGGLNPSFVERLVIDV